MKDVFKNVFAPVDVTKTNRPGPIQTNVFHTRDYLFVGMIVSKNNRRGLMKTNVCPYACPFCCIDTHADEIDAPL